MRLWRSSRGMRKHSRELRELIPRMKEVPVIVHLTPLISASNVDVAHKYIDISFHAQSCNEHSSRVIPVDTLHTAPGTPL